MSLCFTPSGSFCPFQEKDNLFTLVCFVYEGKNWDFLGGKGSKDKWFYYTFFPTENNKMVREPLSLLKNMV